ncbi:hypothetical protein LTR74_011964 [Friedmanniomyces endolithicus]|nr:hypothetical protein LTR74_011964 [Friedmanniomyces endolithicus]
MAGRVSQMARPSRPTTSFSTKRINATTFVIREDDSFAEHPLIYAKVHPKAPVIVLSDTGSDEPSEEHKHDDYIHLRTHLEHCPIPDNNDQPLNPSGKLKYIIICTHCHYDHTLGVPQFLRGGTTEIVASAAGRDFIESDLEDHGEFGNIGRPTPFYQVTKWAQVFERLQYPFEHDWDVRGRNLPCADAMPNIFPGLAMSTQGSPPVSALPTRLRQAAMQQSPPSSNPSQKKLGTQLQRHQPLDALHAATLLDNFDFDAFLNNTTPSYPRPLPAPIVRKTDLGITIIQTPGHTPDELAWYDHDEMHLYKLAVFVRTENARAAAIVDDGHAEGKDETESSGDEEDDWVHVPASSMRRVKISCAHQTYSVDGAEILAELESFSFRVFKGDVPVVETKKWHDGEIYDLWREKGEKRTPMSIFCARRLMEDARRFFGHADSSE